MKAEGTVGEHPDAGIDTAKCAKLATITINSILAGVDILTTFSIVFYTLIFSHNILPQFPKSKKRHYPPDIFHFFQKGTTRQSFFKFFHKKGTTRQPFITFS